MGARRVTDGGDDDDDEIGTTVDLVARRGERRSDEYGWRKTAWLAVIGGHYEPPPLAHTHAKTTQPHTHFRRHVLVVPTCQDNSACRNAWRRGGEWECQVVLLLWAGRGGGGVGEERTRRFTLDRAHFAMMTAPTPGTTHPHLNCHRVLALRYPPLTGRHARVLHATHTNARTNGRSSRRCGWRRTRARRV